MRKKIHSINDRALQNQWRRVFATKITLEQFETLTMGQYSRNSMLAMVKDWNLFNSFCQSKNVCPLPASVTAVRRFIEHEAVERKFATLKRYSVTISLVHRILADSDPVANSQVRLLIAKYRIDKHGDAKQAAGFSIKHLQALDKILATSTSYKDIRNLTIYYLMFECALKRSELKQIKIRQVTALENSSALRIGDNNYPLSGQASVVLTKWLNVSGGNDDLYLFRAIDRHGNISLNKMDDSSIYRVLRNASESLSLSINFSGQSTRVGAAQHLSKAGANIKEIQDFGRWLSPAMPYQYIGSTQLAEDEQQTFVLIRPWE